MKVGDLVKMVGDPHNIVGVIVELIDDATSWQLYYKVSWMSDLCEPYSYADENNLELVSECG